MLKIFIKLVATFMIAVSAQAGTVGGDANGRLYNTAYFDITLKNQNPMLDYIKYSKRGSFDVEQFTGTVNKIQETYIRVKVHGRIQIPSDITTKQVYIYNGTHYNYEYSNEYKLEIFYNNSKTYQNAEYFLVDTKTDKFGNRYVDHSINFLHYKPWQVHTNSNTVPRDIIFQVAPYGRGFKNKFQKADIYVLDE